MITTFGNLFKKDSVGINFNLNHKSMLHYIHLTERKCNDPQEVRAMAHLRKKSLEWLSKQYAIGKFLYVFKSADNYNTHLFVECGNHFELHQLLDANPIISYCHIKIEPLISPIESATSLEKYLGKDILTSKELSDLEFDHRIFDENAKYILVHKEVMPFSPLLSLEIQDKIHYNTLVSQKAHGDDRELVDYNPVARSVGILIIKANTLQEAIDHVADCEVYIDTTVNCTELMSLQQALIHNELIINNFNVGCFGYDI